MHCTVPSDITRSTYEPQGNAVPISIDGTPRTECDSMIVPAMSTTSIMVVAEPEGTLIIMPYENGFGAAVMP